MGHIPGIGELLKIYSHYSILLVFPQEPKITYVFR